MARRITDPDFRVWEAFLNPAPHQDGDHAQIIFRCVSDPTVASRASAAQEAGAAESLLSEAPVQSLLEVLTTAQPLS